jgi:hypothetical protein
MDTARITTSFNSKGTLLVIAGKPPAAGFHGPPERRKTPGISLLNGGRPGETNRARPDRSERRRRFFIATYSKLLRRPIESAHRAYLNMMLDQERVFPAFSTNLQFLR